MAQKSTWMLIYKFNTVNSIDLSEVLWHEMKVATHQNEFQLNTPEIFGCFKQWWQSRK